MHDDNHFMAIALEEARKGGAAGNQPVGSLIVKDGKILGRGHNTVVMGHDVTAHAETEAIRDACRNLNTEILAGTTCYSTIESCPMCLYAIVISKASRLVIAARHVDIKRVYGTYTVEKQLQMINRKLELAFTSAHRDEAAKLYFDWVKADPKRAIP